MRSEVTEIKVLPDLTQGERNIAGMKKYCRLKLHVALPVLLRTNLWEVKEYEERYKKCLGFRCEWDHAQQLVRVSNSLPQQTVLSRGILGPWLTKKLPVQIRGFPAVLGCYPAYQKDFVSVSPTWCITKHPHLRKFCIFTLHTSLGFKNTDKVHFGICYSHQPRNFILCSSSALIDKKFMIGLHDFIF